MIKWIKMAQTQAAAWLRGTQDKTQIKYDLTKQADVK